MSDPELFGPLLRRLREERRWSVPDLSARTVDAARGVEGGRHLSERQIRKLEGEAGRVPELATIQVLARAFGVALTTFYEYPIARARAAARESPEQAERRVVEATRKAAARARRK